MEVPKRGALPCDACSGGGLRGAGVRILVGVLRVRGARGVVRGGHRVRVPVLYVDGTGAGEAAGV